MNDPKRYYFALIKTTNETFLLVNDRGGSVMAWDALDKAKAYFEGAYNRNHGRGYEASMSAAINWMTFQPSIIQSTLDEMIPFLAYKPDPDEGGKPMVVIREYRNVSGSMTGLPCNDKGEALWESGDRPALVREL